MFTEKAKSSLENLLEVSLESSFGSQAQCASANKKQIKDKQRVSILTLSSYSFRILILVFYNEDDLLRKFIGEETKINPGAVDEASVRDYMQEVGNSICGTMKRELGASLTHLGMSTPYILEQSSMEYLEKLDFSFQVYKKVTLGAGLELVGGIAASAQTDIDFHFDRTSSDDGVDLGELEMF